MIPENILMPVKGGRFRYPFDTMKVGDYFLVTILEVSQSAYRSARHHAKTNPGRKYEKRRTEEGWRIYRVR